MPLSQALWRLPVAILGGLAGLYAFPTENIWIFGLLIPALSIVSVLGTGFWWGSILGFIAGLVFYVSHIEWISLYLGPVPLIALATLQALFYAPALGLIAVVFKRLTSKKASVWILSLAFAAIWSTREWLSTNFPYGGFPWSRLAMTASNSPLANWVFWGGMSLLSFVIAFLGSILAISIYKAKKIKGQQWAKVSIVSLVLFLVPIFTPLSASTSVTDEITVAAVQGNAKAGLFSREPQGTILQNHLDATYKAIQNQQVDLIVWPENASDIDPLRDSKAREKIEELSNISNADFVFGTITARGSEVFNSTILWKPNIGPTDYYDKKRPVPFAEFVPDRDFWRALAPDLIDMVPRGYSFGVRDGLYEIDDYLAGTLICFEIAEDDIPRELAQSGAQVILSQTNNADFGYSDETWQQSAIAKLRAIETGRTVVNVSTVGHSAIYKFDGRIQSELTWYTPDAMIEEIELRAGITPAVAIGAWLDFIIVLLTVSLLSYAFGLRGRKS